MSIFYGVACLLSVILLVGYFFVDKKREKWLMLLFISILICNTGYFMLSLSKTLTFALISNCIAYIGNVFLPFFMLMLILKVCNINHQKALKYILLCIGIVILFIATTGGYLPIYYKEVSLEIVEGGAKLVKEYGPLHILYFVYLFGYMASMVAVLIYSMVKKKLTSKMHASFLCVSYILNECLLLFLYGMIREYELIKTKKGNETNSSIPIEEIIIDKFTEEQASTILKTWGETKVLTKREREILKEILLGQRRKDIAQKFFISDSAVRNHTTNIFKKLQVESRNELYNKAKLFM